MAKCGKEMLEREDILDELALKLVHAQRFQTIYELQKLSIEFESYGEDLDTIQVYAEIFNFYSDPND